VDRVVSKVALVAGLVVDAPPPLHFGVREHLEDRRAVFGGEGPECHTVAVKRGE
jgi:hypothetical protein